MKAYLVITNPKSLDLKYEDIYRVFISRDEAIAHAKKGGYSNMFGFNDKIGIKNWYSGGDIDISIIPIEIETPPCRALIEDSDDFTDKEISDDSVMKQPVGLSIKEIVRETYKGPSPDSYLF